MMENNQLSEMIKNLSNKIRKDINESSLNLSVVKLIIKDVYNEIEMIELQSPIINDKNAENDKEMSSDG